MPAVQFPDLPPAPAPKPANPLRRLSRRLGAKRRLQELLARLADPEAVARTREAARDADLRQRAIADPAGLLASIRGEREAAPERLFPAQAEALLTARTAGWAAAAPLFRAIAAEPLDGPGAEALLAPAHPYPPTRLVAPVLDRPISLPASAAGIVVYTVATGGRPPLHPVPARPGLRFVCFADQDLSVPGWEIHPLRAGSAAFHKICAHKVLAAVAPDAEASLYVAPDRLAIGNLDTLFTRWLAGSRFAAWRHEEGRDWHDLAERRLVGRPAAAAAVLAQAEACAAADVPRDLGLRDTSLLWRRHRDPAIARLMDAWWRAEEAAPGADEMSLCRAVHGAGGDAAPDLLPEALGRAGLNIFFGRYGRPPVPRPDSPALRAARIPVAFVYHDRWRDHGITLMRGRQLSRMIAERCADRYEVSFTSDIEAVRDQVVIVNRGVLQGHDTETLARLKARNPLMVSDWLDLPVVAEKNRLFDAHLAMSPLQALDMSRRYPDQPCFYVTHHVNPDVPSSSTPPTDRLRTGYFGLLDNTVLPGTLRGSVELVSAVDASFTAAHWQAAAPRFNCHWIVRRISQWEWHKPFLKGFVAARCGAVVIVTRDDLNAAFYLGDDYPYFAESADEGALEMTWLRAEAGFGGPDWRKAVEIMRQVAARSTDAQVVTEFRFMLDELLR